MGDFTGAVAIIVVMAAVGTAIAWLFGLEIPREWAVIVAAAIVLVALGIGGSWLCWRSARRGVT
jgi:putative effector of murein hydrolase LrgA (UPF0299 family)